MQWYLKVMKENYSNFSGRARRKEYWMFALLMYVILIFAIILDGVMGLRFDIGYGVESSYGWITLLVYLLHFIPSFSVSVRRLHDVGKSGWFMLIVLIPIIGGIWLLILACTDGDSGDNAYGGSPKVD